MNPKAGFVPVGGNTFSTDARISASAKIELLHGTTERPKEGDETHRRREGVVVNNNNPFCSFKGAFTLVLLLQTRKVQVTIHQGGFHGR